MYVCIKHIHIHIHSPLNKLISNFHDMIHVKIVKNIFSISEWMREIVAYRDATQKKSY